MANVNPLPAARSLILVTVVLTGCPDGPHDPCKNGGADEVAENECEPSDDGGPLGPDECMHNENPNVDGYRVQCEGEFHSKIDFHLALVDMNCVEALGPEFCAQIHPFGPPFDTYAAPDVMACCGEAWDPAAYLDVYQDSCMHDLTAQACASAAIRLEQAIEAGKFGDYGKKAENLHAYIESHLLECSQALYDSDTNPDPGQLVSQWTIPNKKGSKGWWPAKNIVISVEGGTNVVDVHRPDEQADWLACHGLGDNDDEIFEDQTSPGGSIVVDVSLDAEVEGELVGAVVDASKVMSSMTFDANCVDQGCPGASWSYHRGTDPSFTMEDLRLYAVNFQVTSNTAALFVERARVELWRQAQGTKILASDGSVLGYEIPAGQAWFYVAGLTNGVFGRFVAVNSTDIEIAVEDAIWTIGSFDIQSVDGTDKTWTLTLEESRWRP